MRPRTYLRVGIGKHASRHASSFNRVPLHRVVHTPPDRTHANTPKLTQHPPSTTYVRVPGPPRRSPTSIHRILCIGCRGTTRITFAWKIHHVLQCVAITLCCPLSEIRRCIRLEIYGQSAGIRLSSVIGCVSECGTIRVFADCAKPEVTQPFRNL